MSLVEHAKRELEAVNCEEPERTAIVEMVTIFDGMEDLSGVAAMGVIHMLTKLLRFENLAPLSSDPGEWNDIVDPGTLSEPEGLWQSRRRATTFSRDGGKTWFDIDDPSLNNGDTHNREDAAWVECQVGNNVKVGTIVRVRMGAYAHGSATEVNGHDGRVTAIRNGMLAVLHASGKQYNHTPDKLEVLKP